MIDSHCHLHYDPFDHDRDQTIQRAIDNGVTQFILPATDSKTHESLISLTQKYPNVCFATIGVHPTVVNENKNYRKELEQVKSYLENPPVRFIAVGEAGLDYYWSQDFKEAQKETFIFQLELAKKYNLPIIVHTRDAWDDTLEIMEDYTDIKGVFHCFSGTKENWSKIEKLSNMYIGLNATVSYKKYDSIEILTEIPINRVILETDAPYLAPAPHRGKRNEPAYIPLFIDQVAKIYKLSVDQIDKLTTFNTKSLFNI